MKFALDGNRPIYESDRRYLRDRLQIWSKQNLEKVKSIQSEDSKIIKNATANAESPLLVLKMRLAKGEITKEEFDDLKKLLDE